MTIRTKANNNGDYSFTSRPVRIMAVTESHVVYENTGNERKLFGDGKNVLDNRWVDNNWISYDDLLKLATEEHIEMLTNIQ